MFEFVINNKKELEREITKSIVEVLRDNEETKALLARISKNWNRGMYNYKDVEYAVASIVNELSLDKIYDDAAKITTNIVLRGE